MPSAEIATYLVPQCTMPFCKGCGHGHVLKKLNEALVSLQLQPSDICLVTDIGCIGLADSLFESPHTVHTTHGRSTAFATGIALADAVMADGRLKTIVLIGDGGAMIGLLHIVNAALLNVDVTVLLCNNFLFGMTGGQNSAMSPIDFVTPTTPSGNIIPPLDVCRLAVDSHAGFVARHGATDKELTDTIREAISYPGFSLVEIVELCTEHGTTRNELTGKTVQEIIKRNGQQMGRMSSAARAGFGSVYTEKFRRIDDTPERLLEDAVAPLHRPSLNDRICIIIAGSAGEKVQSSAYQFCQAALKSGLYATQKNDNPVTQGSGFSISEIVLAPHPVLYTGIETPDAVIVVSTDGMFELRSQRVFDRLLPTTKLIVDESVEVPPSAAEIISYPFRKTAGDKRAAQAALEYYRQKWEIFPA